MHKPLFFEMGEDLFMSLTVWVGGRKSGKSWTGGRLALIWTLHALHEMANRLGFHLLYP